MTRRAASHDPSLVARIVARHPLRYAAGADGPLDRPAHVRAGSSLAWAGDRLALIQDDANFLALVTPATGHVDVITLPAGESGVRQFGDDRGNKKFKLDLEACCTVDAPTGARLVAFGSGSKRRRRNILTVDGIDTDAPRVDLVDATPLYLALEAATDFSGSDMNIEGAVIVEGRLRLLGRGNGKARDGRQPLDATCDLDLQGFLSWLADPLRGPPPAPTDIVQYDLGRLDAVPLGFTDAASRGSHLVFTASAEDSGDATADGGITGSVIGVMPPGGALRYARLTEAGAATTDKAEGIALAPDDPGRAWIVIDADDPTRPSELCEVRLEGRWF